VEIQPASLTQVQQARGGEFVEITDDVQGVANALHELDPDLRLRWSEAGGYFVVYQITEKPGGGTRKNVVLTAQELDHRIVKRVELVISDDYNYADELDKLDAENDRQHRHRQYEQCGDVGERLAHAIKKDLQAQTRIFVPGRR
jgi:hypothetical protein